MTVRARRAMDALYFFSLRSIRVVNVVDALGDALGGGMDEEPRT